MMWVWAGLQSLTALYLGWVLWDAWRYKHLLLRLADVPLAGPVSAPVAVILAGKDEEARIESTLTSLLRAEGLADLRVHAVNDRSKDATGRIMDGVAAQSGGRLQVTHNSELPAGWMGKNWACWRAAEQALGAAVPPKYLLFTDADVRFHPQAIAQAVSAAETRGLGFLTLRPEMEYEGLWEGGLVCAIELMVRILTRPWSIAKPKSWSYLGMGAFLLVRADAYQRLGGHSKLRFQIVEDMKMGLLFRANKERCMAGTATGRMSVRWQNGFWATLRGLLKNGFASHEYSWGLVLTSAALQILAFFTPAGALVSGDGMTAVAGGVCLLVILGFFGLMEWPSPLRAVTSFFLLPVIGLSVALTGLVSAALTTLGGGVRWRGTFYPLAELKAQNFSGLRLVREKMRARRTG